MDVLVTMINWELSKGYTGKDDRITCDLGMSW